MAAQRSVWTVRMMAAVVELIRVVHTDVVVVLAASSLGLVTIQGLGVSGGGRPLHAIHDGRDELKTAGAMRRLSCRS